MTPRFHRLFRDFAAAASLALAAGQPAPPKPAAALPLPAAGSDAFALFGYGQTHVRGPFTEADRAQAQRHGKSEPFVWVRRAGQTCIVRDPATARAIRELFRSPLHPGSPSDRRRVDLLERDLYLRWRTGQTVAEREQVTERIERLRDPGMTNEDPSVVPGGLEGLRGRLEDERLRLAEVQSRLALERTDLERRKSLLELRETDAGDRAWRLLDEAIATGLAERIPAK